MAEKSTERTRVLVTGASGRIGTAFFDHTADRYQMRLAAHHPEKLAHIKAHEVVPLELSDPDACAAACQDMEVVVHLGGSPSPKAPFYLTLLESNITGTYNILRAAKDAGCRRVVLSSSVQAVAGYPMDQQIHTDSPVRPLNMYGVTKCFMEAAAHCFALAEGLPCIVIRVGNYQGNGSYRQGLRQHARNLSVFISERDMSELLVRCVEVENVQFAILHGVSDNRFKWLDMTSTIELLGWRPQDDGFLLFGSDMLYTDQWIERSPPTDKLSTKMST